MKVRNLKLIVICIFCLPFYSLKSQSLHIGGVFPTIDHSGTLNNKLDYSLYYFGGFPLIDFNNPDISKDAYFHLFYAEQALTYKQTDRLSFTGSYVYQRANVLSSNYVNENRFYLQTKYVQTFQKFKLAHRLRFDGRFIQNRFTNESPFTHRIRYLIGIDVPLGERSYLTGYEELFFNTSKNTNPVYGENWFYTAFGRRLNEQNKIEVGLLYVTWNIGSKNWFNQYYLQFTWINHINLKKKKSEE